MKNEQEISSHHCLNVRVDCDGLKRKNMNGKNSYVMTASGAVTVPYSYFCVHRQIQNLNFMIITFKIFNIELVLFIKSWVIFTIYYNFNIFLYINLVTEFYIRPGLCCSKRKSEALGDRVGGAFVINTNHKK